MIVKHRRAATLRDVIERTGAVEVHPYDNNDVIADLTAARATVSLTVAEWGSATTAGERRRVNEDAWGHRAGTFVVADGMGGRGGGALAARTAIDRFLARLADAGVHPGWRQIVAAVANFFTIPYYPLVVVPIAAAIVLFWRRARWHLAILRVGRPLERTSRVGARIRSLGVFVFGQRRLLQDIGPGLAHAFVFCGPTATLPAAMTPLPSGNAVTGSACPLKYVRRPNT